ncbi:MAG TPA: cyclase family protein [Nitrososphaera sp.]|nr:cyclase family protein [Nitrososphaera sp.]
MGRGVLIDHKRWADGNGKTYNPFTDRRITIEEIELIAKEEGVTFKQGDIIIIRSGYTEALTGISGEEQTQKMRQKTCGVEGTPESAKWFWNKHFAAVASDTMVFEAFPPLVNGTEGAIDQLGKSHQPETFFHIHDE